MPTIEAQRRRTKAALFLASLAVLLSLALAGWALTERFDATNAARANNRATWHAVICSIEQNVVKNKKLTQDEKDEQLGFFDRLLITNVQTDPCGYRVRR